MPTWPPLYSVRFDLPPRAPHHSTDAISGDVQWAGNIVVKACAHANSLSQVVYSIEEQTSHEYFPLELGNADYAARILRYAGHAIREVCMTLQQCCHSGPGRRPALFPFMRPLHPLRVPVGVFSPQLCPATCFRCPAHTPGIQIRETRRSGAPVSGRRPDC